MPLGTTGNYPVLCIRIGIYLLCMPQGTPLCYNKMLHMGVTCVVTANKHMENYKSVLFLLKSTEKKEKKSCLIILELRDNHY